MTWTTSYTRVSSSWLPQITVFGPCDNAIRDLGDAYRRQREAARRIRELGSILLGERLPAREIIMRIPWIIRGGMLEYRDGKVCVFGRCVDAYEFFKAIDDYYLAYRDRVRALRDIEFLCKDVTPFFCRDEVKRFIKAIEDLWEIPVNPRRASRDIRMLAIMKSPKLKEAIEKYGEYLRARRELLRCAGMIL